MIIFVRILIHFNSRPHGGRRTDPESILCRSVFQLTPSRRATPEKQGIQESSVFQLTPSRRATPFFRVTLPELVISTHALTEGDQRSHDVLSASVFISTHALTEGDPMLRYAAGRLRHFNSRPHGGRHLPPLFQEFPRYFNSRPHGGRLYSVLFLGISIHFNSRPHGGRQPSPPLCFLPPYISTHALTEGDAFIGSWRCALIISTHALTEGDLIALEIVHGAIPFQLTPSRRATRRSIRDVFGKEFQLTPSRRATIINSFISENPPFQLTPSRRATEDQRIQPGLVDISTHALTEGDRTL